MQLVHQGFTADGKPETTQETQNLLVAANGQSVRVRIPPEAGQLLTTAWSPDGSKLYAMARPVAGPRRRNWYSISLIDGTATPIAQPIQFYSGWAKSGAVTVRDVPQDTTNGRARQALNALWLETVDPDSQNRLLLAGDASNGAVNETVDCASYIAQGSLFVRPISEVPKKRYELAVIAGERTKLLQQARQGGLALIMFSADSDDVLPNSKQNLYAILGPYMKDPSLLNGFIYTYPGGPITAINDPTKMELGYVDATDGRAVVYADGHVRWVPKP